MRKIDSILIFVVIIAVIAAGVFVYYKNTKKDYRSLLNNSFQATGAELQTNLRAVSLMSDEEVKALYLAVSTGVQTDAGELAKQKFKNLGGQ